MNNLWQSFMEFVFYFLYTSYWVQRIYIFQEFFEKITDLIYSDKTFKIGIETLFDPNSRYISVTRNFWPHWHSDLKFYIL